MKLLWPIPAPIELDPGLISYSRPLVVEMTRPTCHANLVQSTPLIMCPRGCYTSDIASLQKTIAWIIRLYENARHL